MAGMTNVNPMNELPRVFVIGDSISIQYGPYLANFLAGRLHYARKGDDQESLLNLDIPQVPNGGDSSRVLAYLRALQTSGKFKADVLLINAGLHDIKADTATKAKQVPLEAYRENLQEVAKLGRSLAGECVWITTTPLDEAAHNSQQRQFHRYTEDNDAYRAAAAEVMAAAGVPMVDLHAFTTQIGGDLYCDGVHFQDSVRQMHAAHIAGWLIGRYASSTDAR